MAGPGAPRLLPFQIVPQAPQLSGLRPRAETLRRHGADHVETVLVQCKTLDEVLSDLIPGRTPDFVTIDVEGHEWAVMQGFTLDVWRPRVVIIERNFYPDWRILRHMYEKGYAYTRTTGVNDWFERDVMQSRTEMARAAAPHYVANVVPMMKAALAGQASRRSPSAPTMYCPGGVPIDGPTPSNRTAAESSSRAERPLPQKLGSRVVGEHLAAGLAGRAVVHGVARVLDGADRVAAHRARLAGAAVDTAGAVLRRAHVVAGALVLQALGDGLADRRRRRRAAPSRPSLPVIANGESRARWHTSLASRRPSPAIARWSRRKPCSRIDLLGEAGGQLVRLDAVGLRPEVSSGGRRQHAVGRHAPHAGLALGALLGEQQRRSVAVEHEAGLPAAGLGRLLGVDEQPAALHQVDDERHRLERHEEVLAAPADLVQRQAVRRVRRRDARSSAR